MTIKHLVISGGGHSLFQVIGSIQYLEENKYIDINTIETIYGTSAGAIVGTLICLKFDRETIYDYMIKRPWHEVFPIKIQSILDAYTKKGLFDSALIEKCFKPLLDAKDLPLDITLSKFYEYCGIEQHFFTFDINNFELEDISYKTHPDITLIHAIQMTSAIPLIISPVCINDKCYMDGGVICNYPLKYCISSGKDEKEILAFKNQYEEYNKNRVDSTSTLLDYVICFIYKLLFIMNTDDNEPKILNEVLCQTDLMTIDVLRATLSSMDSRKELYEKGIKYAKEFLNITESLEDGVQKLI